MSENGKSEPKFDFSKVNRQWNRDFARSMSEAARASIVLQREPNKDMDEETFNALLDRQEQAINDLDALADKQAELLTKVLVDVPTDWLLDDAPSGPDWNAVESLDLIRADKYLAILELLRTKDIAGEDAKNSDGHSRSRRKRRGQ